MGREAGEVALHTLRAMTDALVHRGPDDEGHWLEGGVGLGHRRLSILDLSPAGRQPMMSPSGRYVLAFNGEIYNHLDLRRQLEAEGAIPNWRGHSDTETWLAAMERWGVEATLQQSVGMFAFVLYDRQGRTLVLGRDRMGEKPLYYGWIGSRLVFASELQALRKFPGFSATIDQEALGLYAALGFVPEPWSIYRGIRKLPPATLITVDLASRAETLCTYWSLGAHRGPFTGEPSEAAEELERLLSEAVSLQKIADVPVGCFLSGGIDSSTVAALMQKSSAAPVRTFAMSFSEKEFDEARHAAAVARHLGTEHTEHVVTPGEILALVPKLAAMSGEPFGDSAQLPTRIMAAIARRFVTVCLSGDGGDELFGGYDKYRLLRRLERLPAKRWLAMALSCIPDGLSPLLERSGLNAYRLAALRRALGAPDISRRYINGQTQCPDPSLYVAGPTITLESLAGTLARMDGLDSLNAVSLMDAGFRLPGQILAKVDRAAMSVSLETRIPLLDHRVVEFAFSLPEKIKWRDGQTKWPLRQVLYRQVPRPLIDRPKRGFVPPIRHWLRGPLRQWADELFAPELLRNSGLHSDSVRHLWQGYVNGTPFLEYRIWVLLMYQAWFVHHA